MAGLNWNRRGEPESAATSPTHSSLRLSEAPDNRDAPHSPADAEPGARQMGGVSGGNSLDCRYCDEAHGIAARWRESYIVMRNILSRSLGHDERVALLDQALREWVAKA